MLLCAGFYRLAIHVGDPGDDDIKLASLIPFLNVIALVIILVSILIQVIPNTGCERYSLIRFLFGDK